MSEIGQCGNPEGPEDPTSPPTLPQDFHVKQTVNSESWAHVLTASSLLSLGLTLDVIEECLPAVC